MKTQFVSIAVLSAVIGMAPIVSANDSASKPLQVKSFGKISYLSGGVGSDERHRLSAMTRDDNLRLSFALRDGHYLGGADVMIRNDKGKEILKAQADGPLLFTKLPSGNYVVEATSRGRTLTHIVNIPAHGQTPIYFVWQDAQPLPPVS